MNIILPLKPLLPRQAAYITVIIAVHQYAQQIDMGKPCVLLLFKLNEYCHAD